MLTNTLFVPHIFRQNHPQALWRENLRVMLQMRYQKHQILPHWKTLLLLYLLPPQRTQVALFEHFKYNLKWLTSKFTPTDLNFLFSAPSVDASFSSPPTLSLPLPLSRVGHGDKLPQAVVKPQVLTHLIEGFVIQEGAEPFPVSSSHH